MSIRSILLPIPATGRRDLAERLVLLTFGLFLYGAALALMVRAGIGVSPWDVLALGIAGRTGMGYGVVTILTSIGVLGLWIPLRQRVGIGTVANVLLIGPSADLVLWLTPEIPSPWVGVPVFLCGLVLLALATGLYISADFGPGPRDGLMTGLVARTGWHVRLVRTLIEGIVLATGFLLGGPVGVGTVVFAAGIGPLVGLILPRLVRMREARSRELTGR